jgi:cytochrome c oxidase cbb3-type subunit 4
MPQMDMLKLHEMLSAVWVVWFFVLFTGILVWVLRPGSRDNARDNAQIPFRNDPN